MAAAAAVAVDLLALRLDPEAARLTVRYSGTAAAVALARAAGASWADLGLGRRELGAGLRAGALGAAAAAAGVAVVAAVPASRRLFADERAAAAAGGRGLAGALARITFAAVPPEELAYRSVLLGLRLRDGPPAPALAWSSALFGLSHIAPTLATMRHTVAHPHLAQHPLRQAAFVAGNVAVTGMAGAVFGWLRLRSGSVLAPLLVHVALNDSALLAGWAVHGRSAVKGD